MSTSYDALPAPLPSGSHIPRRPSGSYSHSYDRPAHSGPMTPPESRRVSYPYESSSSSFYRSPNVLHSEPFHDHRGSYSGGVHERYRVPPPSSRYPRDHDSRYISSPNSSRDRDSSSSRKDSTVGRVSQTSDNWKHSNGTDVERRNSMDRFKLSSPGRIASAEFHGRAHDRDVYTSKASRPSGPAFQERHVRRDSFTSDARDRYNTYRPYDDPSRLYSNSEGYGSRNSRRNLSRSRSFSRSPVRRYSPRPRSRSWSRSKSRSRSPTVSRSRSRSLSRSRSRSPPRRSRLPPRDVDSDAPDHVRSTGSWSRDRNRGISAHTLDKKPVPGPQPHSPKTSARRTIDRASSSFDVIHSRSRSPSHSSIASSRESSVKPCPAPMDEDIIARDSHTEHQPLDGSLQTEVVKTAVTSVTAEYIPQELDSAGSRLDTSLVSEPASDSQSVGQQPSSGFIKPNEVTKTPPDSSFFKDLSNTVAADIQNSQLVDLSMIQEASKSAEFVSAMKQSNVSLESQLQGQQSRARPDQAVNSIGKKSPPDEVITTPRDPIAAPSPIVLYRFSRPPIPEFSPSDIPDIKQVKNLQEALRSVVMTRLLADRQTNEERVEPVLSSNLALPKSSFEAPIPGASVQDVMTELSHPQSARVKARSETAEKIRGSLVERFEERQRNFKEKVQRLTKQYVNLHDKWVAHCTMLDKQAKGKSTALTTDDRASTLALSAPPVTGRTTRRSAATLGDAVRSDLEMEQIIASLNNEASDPNQLCLRNVATIPDMISVTKGKVDHVYDDNNLRVDNPSEYYAPQTGIHDWTEEEKRIFQDKFALFPKQFGAIARFLPNKTASQCVEFYYLHKKVDIDFRNVVAMRAPGRRGKRKSTKRKANALLADIRKHDAEVSESVAGTARGAGGKGKGRRGAAVPAVSVNPAPAPTPVPIPTPVPAVEVKKPSSRRPVAHLESTPTTDTPTPEPEGKSRRRRGAGNRTSIGAAIDGDDDATEEPEARPAKRARRGGRKVLKSAAIVSDDGADDSTPPAVPEDMFSDRDAISRRKLWSDEDSNLFLKLLGQHGDDFKRIAASMPNKTTGQVYAYFKVNLVSMGLDKIVENAPRRSVSPVQAPETVQQVVASAPTPTTEEPDEVPPMASLPLDESRSDTVSSPKPGTPTPHAPENPVASYRDFVNAPAFPTMAAPSGEMATLYTHTSGYGDSRFPRYTTGVAAYGAPPMAMSSLYAAQGYVSAAPGFGPPPTGYPPPPGSAPSTTSIATYAPNGGYASARHYLPYAYPYQTSYPIMTGHPPPAPTPPLGSSSSPAPGVNPYTHALGDPRPFYPYSS